MKKNKVEKEDAWNKQRELKAVEEFVRLGYKVEKK